MTSLLKEFRQFIMRRNVVDLAVAVVIGTAFGAVVAAFVADIITPLIAAIFGQPDFSSLTFTIGKGVIQYGAFINTIIQFLIIALAIFLVIKAINSLRRQEAEAPAADPAPTKTEALLEDIRDALRAPPAAEGARRP